MATATKRLEWWLREGMEQRYWILRSCPEIYVETTGERVRLPAFPEMDLFVSRYLSGWAVHCGVTGCLMYEDRTSTFSTKETAIAEAGKQLKEYLETKDIDLRIFLAAAASEGVSPRYELEEVEVEE